MGRENNRPNRGSNPGKPHDMRGALPVSYMLEESSTPIRLMHGVHVSRAIVSSLVQQLQVSKGLWGLYSSPLACSTIEWQMAIGTQFFFGYIQFIMLRLISMSNVQSDESDARIGL